MPEDDLTKQENITAPNVNVGLNQFVKPEQTSTQKDEQVGTKKFVSKSYILAIGLGIILQIFSFYLGFIGSTSTEG